jgi:hypothetical protein
MAKIEFLHSEEKDLPPSVETVEVRVWEMGGTERQAFYIGSGLNFQACANIWLEFIYSVEGAQILYSRNFLHQSFYNNMDTTDSLERQLDEFVQKGEGRFGFGHVLPETKLFLTIEKFTYPNENDEEKPFTKCKLEISMDTGAVFGRTSPGMRSVDIRIDSIAPDKGVRFMRALIHEIDAVRRGRHPDPAAFLDGSSEWPFVWQLNRQAYNQISATYQEEYFENPLLAEAFDGWLAQLPLGGHVCNRHRGHGQPVIARLLENGFQVTASDFSPETWLFQGSGEA